MDLSQGGKKESAAGAARPGPTTRSRVAADALERLQQEVKEMEKEISGMEGPGKEGSSSGEETSEDEREPVRGEVKRDSPSRRRLSFFGVAPAGEETPRIWRPEGPMGMGMVGEDNVYPFRPRASSPVSEMRRPNHRAREGSTEEADRLLEEIFDLKEEGKAPGGCGDPCPPKGPPLEEVVATLAQQVARLQLQLEKESRASAPPPPEVKQEPDRQDEAIRAQSDFYRAELRRMANQHAKDVDILRAECRRWRDMATADEEEESPPREAKRPSSRRQRAGSPRPRRTSPERRTPKPGKGDARRGSDGVADFGDPPSSPDEWSEAEEEPLTPFLVPRNPRCVGRSSLPFFAVTASSVATKELKMAYFTGKEVRFPDWLYRFECMAALRCFTHADLGTHLIAFLRDEPSTLCKRVRCIGRPYTNVRNDVYLKITGAKTKTAEKANWKSMKRGAKESVAIYLERLKDQAGTIMEGFTEKDPIFFEFVKDKFIGSAWADYPMAKTFTTMSNPRSWEELWDKAGAVEGSVQEALADAAERPALAAPAQITVGAVEMGPMPDIAARGASQSSAPPKESTQGSGGKRGGKGQRSRDRADGHSTPSKNRSRDGGGDSNRPQRKRSCKVCGMDNHWTDQCWELEELVQSRKQASAAAKKDAPAAGNKTEN